jgi:hypothetical protein
LGKPFLQTWETGLLMVTISCTLSVLPRAEVRAQFHKLEWYYRNGRTRVDGCYVWDVKKEI